MKEKSRMLLHPEPQDANNDSDPEEISLQLANRMMEEEELSSEDRKAITLKEAFDRTINKLGSEVEEEEDPETMDAERSSLWNNCLMVFLKCFLISCFSQAKKHVSRVLGHSDQTAGPA